MNRYNYEQNAKLAKAVHSFVDLLKQIDEMEPEYRNEAFRLFWSECVRREIYLRNNGMNQRMDCSIRLNN